MYLWGVAVLELDSHTEHSKGPPPCACPKTHQMAGTSFIITSTFYKLIVEIRYCPVYFKYIGVILISKWLYKKLIDKIF